MSLLVRKLAPHLFSAKPQRRRVRMAHPLQKSISAQSGDGSDKSFVIAQVAESHVEMPPMSQIPSISALDRESVHNDELAQSSGYTTDPMLKRIVALEQKSYDAVKRSEYFMKALTEQQEAIAALVAQQEALAVQTSENIKALAAQFKEILTTLLTEIQMRKSS
uniref:Uncharacterized protein n=1 Tax=Mycena chlorophos TaxID=658473 RepID=A0ABQ0L0L5_MYCCL|nr:predicted protein [Mycena chlorophos]